ncbi:MAG: DNRLRE domain-containing protein [Actinobacteria bacterium]|nr:DNRLRE domain-containing protein [Actinomycetota bacterium]
MKAMRKAMAALLVAAMLAIANLPTRAASTTTIPADADSFVLSTRPTANKGTATTLRVRNDTEITYMRFRVSGLPAGHEVSAATLRVYASSAGKCALGVDVFRAANDTWGETTISWNNQPGPTGPVLANLAWTTKNSYRAFQVTSAVSGSGPVSFLLRHAPGCSVTSGVPLTSREAGSNQPQLLVETIPTTSSPACSDGQDNDGDGLTDYPADPGCTSVSDTDETDPPPPSPACSDGLDNDSDGLTDHPADPGCTDASDTDETDAPPPAPACSDGLDNDSDGLIDHPTDPGCTDASDTDETDAPPSPESENVIAAAGDIVCDPTSSSFGGTNPTVCQHRATAALLSGADVVLPLGDLQYPNGSLDAFNQGYELSWGQDAAKTYPVPGNHEYNTGLAQGYFDYWTSKGRPTGVAGTGYYSFDLGAWHVVALNSQCSAVPCAEGSLQNDFLEQDLASTTETCIVAYWHHPYFNSGAVHGASMPSGVKAFWVDLYAAGADVILNSHEHNYQRYAKQDPLGQATGNGIREFVVGTGGKALYTLLDVKDANYEVGNATDFGVLRLHLAQTSYSWEFVALSGTVLDSGGPVSCN